MSSTGPKSLFNQSLLISTPRPYLIKNSAIFCFHLVAIITQKPLSSISNLSEIEKNSAVLYFK